MGRQSDTRGHALFQTLERYEPVDRQEQEDIRRLLALAQTAHDPWARELSLHVTASALVLHPPTSRVLLRWHERLQDWVQVGGHGEPDESDPLSIALREAAEETGLGDLRPYPTVALIVPIQVVVLPVPAGNGEPVHEHGDMRYLLATAAPEAVAPETEQARLRWVPIEIAAREAREQTLRTALERAAARMP